MTRIVPGSGVIRGYEEATLRLPWHAPGTLANHCWQNVAAMLSGKSPSASTQNAWTTLTGSESAPVAVRNPQVFCAGYSLAAISAFRSGNAPGRLPHTLITPLHMVASHVGVTVGDTVVFVADDNTIHTRTVVGTFYTGPNPNLTTTVSRLNAPLPSSVQPLELMPAEPWVWFNASFAVQPGDPTYPSPRGGRSYSPVVIMKGNPVTGRMTVAGVGFNPTSSFSNQIPHSIMRDWWQTVVGGDSNGPHLLPINGKFVLLSTEDDGSAGLKTGPWTITSSNSANGGFYTGASYVGASLGIGQIVAILGGGYVPAFASLSAFPTYQFNAFAPY